MSNVVFSRVIRLNVKMAFRWKDLLWTIVLFSLIGLFGVYDVVTYPTALSKNVWDVLLVTFSGPGLTNDSLFEFVHWFLPYLFFFYLFGNIAEEDLSQRGVSLVPLIGSRRKWWLGEVVTLLILSLFYVVTGVATILIVSRCFLPWSTHLSPFLLSSGIWQTIPKDLSVATLLLRWIFPLFFGTLVAVSFLQMALSLQWRNAFLSFIAASAMMILSWLFGIRHPFVVRWLPGSQSMLLRHTFLEPKVRGFSLAWSLGYNAVIILAVLAVSFVYIRRIDIVKEISEIHKEA
jgi:hypothetical protein